MELDKQMPLFTEAMTTDVRTIDLVVVEGEEKLQPTQLVCSQRSPN